MTRSANNIMVSGKIYYTCVKIYKIIFDYVDIDFKTLRYAVTLE